MPELRWQKSSYSQEASACVYLATAPDTTLRLRESDEPDVVLHTSRAALAALIATVKKTGRLRRGALSSGHSPTGA